MLDFVSQIVLALGIWAFNRAFLRQTNFITVLLLVTRQFLAPYIYWVSLTFSALERGPFVTLLWDAHTIALIWYGSVYKVVPQSMVLLKAAFDGVAILFVLDQRKEDRLYLFLLFSAVRVLLYAVLIKGLLFGQVEMSVSLGAQIFLAYAQFME